MSIPTSVRHEVYYSGRVQGVGFRYTARSVASRYPVAGFVKNLPDGRVHLVVEGESAHIRAFLHELRTDMDYCIRDVQETVGPASGRFRGFEVRF